MVLIAVPLILGKVPPNLWYGVRTRKTLSSPALWYKANRMGGICFLASTAAAVAVWTVLLALPMSHPFRPAAYLIILALCQGVGITILLARLKNL